MHGLSTHVPAYRRSPRRNDGFLRVVHIALAAAPTNYNDVIDSPADNRADDIHRRDVDAAASNFGNADVHWSHHTLAADDDLWTANVCTANVA
jgi:hypothetical protein